MIRTTYQSKLMINYYIKCTFVIYISNVIKHMFVNVPCLMQLNY